MRSTGKILPEGRGVNDSIVEARPEKLIDFSSDMFYILVHGNKTPDY